MNPTFSRRRSAPPFLRSTAATPDDVEGHPLQITSARGGKSMMTVVQMASPPRDCWSFFRRPWLDRRLRDQRLLRRKKSANRARPFSESSVDSVPSRGGRRRAVKGNDVPPRTRLTKSTRGCQRHLPALRSTPDRRSLLREPSITLATVDLRGWIRLFDGTCTSPAGPALTS